MPYADSSRPRSLDSRCGLLLPYAHGFAHVAACTLEVTIADPAADTRAVLRRRGSATTTRWRWRCSPSCATGYAIEDLLLQDTCWIHPDGPRRHRGRQCGPAAGAGRRRAARPRHRVLNCAVVVHRGQVLGVAAKSYLPTYREFYERRRFAPADDRRGSTSRWVASRIRSAPTCSSRPPTIPTEAAREICEDMGSDPAERRGLPGRATVLANLSGSPITIAPARSAGCSRSAAPAPRCSAAYVFAAAGQGESPTDLSWNRQTMVYECGDLLGRGTALPRGRGPHGHRASRPRASHRTGCARARSTTTGDYPRARGSATSAHRFTLALRQRVGLRCARWTASRWCQTSRGWPSTATRPTTSRVSRPRAADDRHGPSPRRSSGSAAASTSTQALIVTAEGDGPARPAALGHPRVHDAGVRDRGHHTVAGHVRLAKSLGGHLRGARHPAGRRAECCGTSTTPTPTVSRSTTSPSRNNQAGLRYDYLSGLANHRGGIIIGAGDLFELALGWSPTASATRCRTTTSTRGCPRRWCST